MVEFKELNFKFIILAAVSILAVVCQSSKFCPTDPEYFKEADSDRRYCGEICILEDQTICNKAKSNGCCRQKEYYNVTKLVLDLSETRFNFKQTSQELFNTTKERDSLEKENKKYKTDLDESNSSKTIYLYLFIGAIVIVFLLIGVVIYFIRKYWHNIGKPETSRTNRNVVNAPAGDGELLNPEPAVDQV